MLLSRVSFPLFCCHSFLFRRRLLFWVNQDLGSPRFATGISILCLPIFSRGLKFFFIDVSPHSGTWTVNKIRTDDSDASVSVPVEGQYPNRTQYSVTAPLHKDAVTGSTVSVAVTEVALSSLFPRIASAFVMALCHQLGAWDRQLKEIAVLPNELRKETR